MTLSNVIASRRPYRRLLLAAALAAAPGGAHAQLANVNPSAVSPPPPPFTAIPAQTPGPGSITVRLDARINSYFNVGSDSGRNATVVTPNGANGQPNTKLANYAFGSYARLFPAFDGIAGNGLKYGAFLEIRQDQGAPPGGGVNGSISASNRSRAALFYRRQFAYVGADQYGTLRYGATDQATGLLLTGTFENFNDGGWNGDKPSYFTNGTTLTWPFPGQAILGVTEKIVYLSPQYQGFDFGLSFEPNTGVMNGGPGNCPYNYTSPSPVGVNGPLNQGNGTGCDAASATATGDAARRRNMVDGALRWRGVLGPVGIAATVGGMVGGRVLDNSTPAAATQFTNLSVFDTGLVFTYGGLALGGHITTGQANGSFNLKQSGQRNSFAWLAGGSYAFGPFIIGASYFDYASAGVKGALSDPTVGNRREQGISAGGTYTFAPGMNVFLSYLYGTRAQGGFDFLSGAVSSAGARVVTHNNVLAQGIQIGTQFRW